MPTAIFRYDNQFIGYGDGVNVDFQLGDGIYPTAVTHVYVNSVETFDFTSTGTGLITLGTSPAIYDIVSASGVETA
jgi:hypothetical protein